MPAGLRLTVPVAAVLTMVGVAVYAWIRPLPDDWSQLPKRLSCQLRPGPTPPATITVASVDVSHPRGAVLRLVVRFAEPLPPSPSGSFASGFAGYLLTYTIANNGKEFAELGPQQDTDELAIRKPGESRGTEPNMRPDRNTNARRTAPDTVEINLETKRLGLDRGAGGSPAHLRRSVPHAVDRDGGLRVAILSGRAFGRAASLIVGSPSRRLCTYVSAIDVSRWLSTARTAVGCAQFRRIGALGGHRGGVNARIAARGRSLGLRAHRARAAGVGHCALAVVGDPSGTGRTLAAAAAEQPGLPGRLAVGLGRGDRRLCCGLRRTWRFEHNIAGLGILATGGPRVGTDRVRRASVADPASPHRNAGLDARIRQLHPGTRRIGRGRAGGGETRGADHLRGGRIAIGSGGHGAAGSWIYTAFFAMLAASTVAIPILAYVAAGDRLDDSLERLKDWMEKNHAGMVAAILVVIGLLLLYNGVHAM